MAVAGNPAEGQPLAVQAAFDRLRERFVAGLPQRWQEIEAAGSGPALAAPLHRLVGAAASYGLSQLGEAARRAEGLADGRADGRADAATPASAEALADALGEVRRWMDAAVVTVR
jgi:HPt (histidine-containing phosphotransfer) domain-containing protein